MENIGEFVMVQATISPSNNETERWLLQSWVRPTAKRAASHGTVEVLPGRALDRRGREGWRGSSCLYSRRGILWLPLLCLFAMVACASAQTGGAVPSVETIVARMAQARDQNRVRFRPFIVTRDYKLFGKERYKTKAEVIADVTFVPPDSKTYAVQQARGTGLGEAIVRRMLESEAEVARDYRATDISPDNYDFRFIRVEDVGGHRCYMFELLPKRQDKNLLRGNIWVDADSFLLQRIDGQPAKSLSWWLRDVRIALLYGEVGGVWLQTTFEATANVRLLGWHTIVSRDVKYDFSRLVAGVSGPTTLSGHIPDGSLR